MKFLGIIASPLAGIGGQRSYSLRRGGYLEYVPDWVKAKFGFGETVSSVPFKRLEPVLRPELRKILESKFGWREMTRTQANCIPSALLGNSLLASGYAGTGKTAIFLIPILNYLFEREKEIKEFTRKVTESSEPGPRWKRRYNIKEDKDYPAIKYILPEAVIVAPTNELVHQIESVLKTLDLDSSFIRFQSLTSKYRGAEQKTKMLRITQPNIVIGTPSRLLQLAEETSNVKYQLSRGQWDEIEMSTEGGVKTIEKMGFLDFSACKILALDECDELFHNIDHVCDSLKLMENVIASTIAPGQAVKNRLHSLRELSRKKNINLVKKRLSADRSPLILDTSLSRADIDQLDLERYEPERKEKLQRVFVSATLPIEAFPFLKKYLGNHILVDLNKTMIVPAHIKQVAFKVSEPNKIDLLQSLFLADPKEYSYSLRDKQVIVFCDGLKPARRVHKELQAQIVDEGESKERISLLTPEGMTMHDREVIMEKFRESKVNVLVCEASIGRGLDLVNTDVVILMTVPVKVTEYMHLVGRCGRNQRPNCFAITLVNRDAYYMPRSPSTGLPDCVFDERRLLARISDYMGRPISYTGKYPPHWKDLEREDATFKKTIVNYKDKRGKSLVSVNKFGHETLADLPFYEDCLQYMERRLFEKRTLSDVDRQHEEPVRPTRKRLSVKGPFKPIMTKKVKIQGQKIKSKSIIQGKSRALC